jgi:hypothetical protein
MSQPVDMTYSFTWDTEPTDEQLQTLMEEVALDVRRQSIKAQESVRQAIQDEYAKALATQRNAGR